MGYTFLTACSLVIISIGIVTTNNENGIFHSKFRRIFTDHRCMNTYVDYSVLSRYICGGKCVQDTNCHGFNYHESSGLCQLIDGWFDLYNTSYDTGFSVFKKAQYGPYLDHDFVNAGSYSVALHTDGVVYQDALTACQPLGRLIQIDTLEKFTTVTTYLKSIRTSDDDYTNVWTDGHYDSGHWVFSDGGLLPVIANPELIHSDESTPTCLRLKYSSGDYMWRDCTCDRVYSYLCEKL